MAPRPDVSEERKEQILEAAMDVFARSGFHGARMDDIAEQAGLSKGALYWYFDGKDAIIQGIMDRLFAGESEQLRELLKTDMSAQIKLQTFIDLAIEEIKSMESMIPIMIEFWSLLLRKKKVSGVLGGYYSGYLDLIVPMIQQGIDTGEFRQVNPLDVGVTLAAFFEGLFVLWSAIPDIVVLERHMRSGSQLIIESLLKSE